MTILIPSFTAIAGLVAAIFVLKKLEPSSEASAAAGVDPEAAADRMARVSIAGLLAFSSLVVTTLVCLTVQLGTLVNPKAPYPVKSKSTAGNTVTDQKAAPKDEPAATKSGTEPSE